jgi:hypothetical protein
MEQSMGRELVMRNCRTDFYGDEILGEAHKFDEAYFRSVRLGGYSAIWLRGQLRQLVVFEEAPHWNHRNAERMDALRGIVARGRDEGVSVYLYINEPKGFGKGDPIFEKFPDLQGPYNPFSENPLLEGDEPAYAFCTQSEFAGQYLTGGFRRLFEQCPDLAGVIMITASEILSHCYSNVDVRNLLNEDFKFREVQCPRCRNVSATDTVIDVIEKIRAGIREAGSSAQIVAWNWSWGMYEEAPQRGIISGLSRDVSILCDMQRGGSKTVDGIDLIVDEYSFSYLGPSPLFLGTAEVARETGHALWAKIMVNVTHEFLVVPCLPLPFRLAKKMISVRECGIAGFLGCWNYGGDTETWMARLGAKVLTDEEFTRDRIDPEVRALAREIYADRAQAAYDAWLKFDEAFEFFPFDLFLIYYGPHMHGTGFEWAFTPEEIPMPWYFKAAGGRCGTALADWCGKLTPQQIIALLEKLNARWQDGVKILGNAFGVADPLDEIPTFEALQAEPGAADFYIARTVLLHFQSTVAFVKFRLATLAYFGEPSRQEEIRSEILALLEAEKPRIRAMAQIVSAYPRIPYSEEAQRALYTPADLAGKLSNIQAFAFQEGQRI